MDKEIKSGEKYLKNESNINKDANNFEPRGAGWSGGIYHGIAEHLHHTHSSLRMPNL